MSQTTLLIGIALLAVVVTVILAYAHGWAIGYEQCIRDKGETL